MNFFVALIDIFQNKNTARIVLRIKREALRQGLLTAFYRSLPALASDIFFNAENGFFQTFFQTILLPQTEPESSMQKETAQANTAQV